jgi:hypothetical protein
MAKIPRKSGSSDGFTVATRRAEPVLSITSKSMKAFHPITRSFAQASKRGAMRKRTLSAAKLDGEYFAAADPPQHHLKHAPAFAGTLCFRL